MNPLLLGGTKRLHILKILRKNTGDKYEIKTTTFHNEYLFKVNKKQH